MGNLANSLNMAEAKNINQPSVCHTDLVLFTLTNSHSNAICAACVQQPFCVVCGCNRTMPFFFLANMFYKKI